MDIAIRRLADQDIDAVLDLSVAAWAPVFRSFAHILGPTIYPRLFPDWHTSQRAAVAAVCHDHEHMTVWVADVDGVVAGFLAYTLNTTEHIGEVHMLAVHPTYQNRGIGTTLNTFALTKLKESGMQLAVVGTGGDPGHAPARAAYEKVGYTALPAVQYYKAL